eukprot:1198315-Pleurochrysis_carterae.AAC.1
MVLWIACGKGNRKVPGKAPEVLPVETGFTRSGALTRTRAAAEGRPAAAWRHAARARASRRPCVAVF